MSGLHYGAILNSVSIYSSVLNALASFNWGTMTTRKAGFRRSHEILSIWLQFMWGGGLRVA